MGSIIYMEATLGLILASGPEGVEFVKKLTSSGEVKQTESGITYLKIESNEE